MMNDREKLSILFQKKFSNGKRPLWYPSSIVRSRFSTAFTKENPIAAENSGSHLAVSSSGERVWFVMPS